MSGGWSPTGTLVNPGKSTNVIVRTFGDTIRRRIGSDEMQLRVGRRVQVSQSKERERAAEVVKNSCSTSTHPPVIDKQGEQEENNFHESPAQHPPPSVVPTSFQRASTYLESLPTIRSVSATISSFTCSKS
jgi:hypothetical protein